MEECVVKVVKENEEETCSQDNLRLDRTKSNIPKYIDRKNSDVCKHASGNREGIARRGTLTQIPSESRNWPDENLQGRVVKTKN